MWAASLVVTLAFMPSTAMADFTENFESYALGNINGQGPWVDFGGAETPDVSNAQASSGSQSLALSTTTAGAYGSDVYVANINNGTAVTSGAWNLSYQMYIPSSFDGQLQMYISQGEMPTTFEEGGWIQANNNAGASTINRASTVIGATPAALLLDQWAEVSALIDLDNDTLELSYNGAVFHTGAWDVQNPGAPSIGGINFWVDNGTTPGSIFLDDFSFTAVPEPSSLVFASLAMVGLLGRRRTR